jgi:hypothetical protein
MCGCNNGCSSTGQRGLRGEPGIQGLKGDTGPAGGLFTCDTYTAFAGGGQASATNLIDNDNLVETVATTGDSVKLLPALKNAFQKVRNYGANTMNVYPQSGDAIDALGINVPYPLSAGGIVEFVCFVDGTFKS